MTACALCGSTHDLVEHRVFLFDTPTTICQRAIECARRRAQSQPAASLHDAAGGEGHRLPRQGEA